MKIIANKSDLLKGVNIALRAVPVRTTMPILECIIIDATEEDITLLANDMELGIETKVKGEIVNQGKIALDAKFLSEILRKLPDNEVEIETDDNYTASIKCENSLFNISGKDADDFSYLPYVERDNMVTMSQFNLKEIIRQTIFSIGESESNPLMGSEHVEAENGILKMVALDRYRVSIRSMEIEGNVEKLSLNIPGKTLNEISKILTGDAESMVNIFFTDNHVLFEFDNTIVLSRLVDGEYFKVNQMINNASSTKIVVNKKYLVDCVDRATVFVKEGNKKPVIFKITDGNMNISINSTLGKMNENILISKEGNDIDIAFDPKFLIDALRVIDDENVSIYFINSKAPCTIKDDNGKYIYLILPVNF